MPVIRSSATKSVGVVAVMALAVAGCSSSKPQSTSSASNAGASAPASASSVPAPAKAKKSYNLSFIQGVAGDELYICMQCGIEGGAAKLGAKVTTQGPQKFDPPQHKPIVDSVAPANPDAILIAPTDVT